jgi:hypothetical protein
MTLSPSEVWDVVNYVRHGLIPDGAASGSATGGKPK